MGYYDPPEMAEGTYSIECKGYMPEDCHAVPVEIIDQLQTIVLNSPKLGDDLMALRRQMLAMPKAVDVECNFDGKVDAQFSGGKTAYTAYWTCPRCGTEGEEDREVGDDHPDL